MQQNIPLLLCLLAAILLFTSFIPIKSITDKIKTKKGNADVLFTDKVNACSLLIPAEPKNSIPKIFNATKYGPEISIYPGINKDLVNLKLTKIPFHMEIQLINIIGQVVKKINVGASSMNTRSMDINDLKSGLYLIRCDNGGKVITKKLSVRL